ncbi:hypothetical protein [Bacillus sp. MUM 13]|nr:hypothetical protein [Bacillus sp. MUM 13]
MNVIFIWKKIDVTDAEEEDTDADAAVTKVSMEMQVSTEMQAFTAISKL